MKREPEYDELTRNQALGWQRYNDEKCPDCGRHGHLVPITESTRDVTWPDGTVVQVSQAICLWCGSVDIIRRDFNRAHEKDKPAVGSAMAKDGRKFISHYPLDSVPPLERRPQSDD